jgi:hydroxylaminobenzene mutase
MHNQTTIGCRLVRLGILLVLLGLLTGFSVQKLANPRMGLSAHLEGIMNGMLLAVLGLVWERLRLSRRWSSIASWLAMYSTYASWAFTLLAAFWGAGASMMPIAAQGHQGTRLQELVIAVGLGSLSLSVLACCGLVLWGLRRGHEPADAR